MGKEFVMGARMTLKDAFTQPVKSITNSIDKLGNSMDKSSKHANHMGQEMDKAGKAAHKASHGGMLDMYKSTLQMSVVMGTLAVAASPVVVAFSSMKKAMSFEAQMSSIKALTGLSKAEMSEMSTLALKMGAQTKYSALEAAQGIEELLKAGLTPAQVKAGGLGAALNLAAAGGLELAKSAEIMSTALNAFKADAMTPEKAADILASTANASATSVEELSYSLAQSAAVASGVGMHFKDANIALGLFANNGLKGSDAGTSLKSLLMNLQPQTDKQTKLMKQLGLITASGGNAFFTAQGKLKSLSEMSSTLRKSMEKLTDQQRLQYMETIFGSDAIRAANILFKEGADGVKKFSDAMNVTALDVAKEKMDNAAGAVEQLQGALETMQISALLPTMPLIKKAALHFADLTEQYGPKLAEAMESGVNEARDYVRTHFTNNPEFNKLTVSGKVGFVFDELGKTFKEWLANGGQDKLNHVGVEIVNIMASGLEASGPRIISAAGTLGKSMAGAIVTSFAEALHDSWVGAILAGAAGGAAIGSVVPGLGTVAGALIGGASGGVVKAIDSMEDNYDANLAIQQSMRRRDPEAGSAHGSHANGLDRVPFDGYRAILHKDETVLTASEADARRKGKSGVSVSISNLIGQLVITGTGKNSREIANEVIAIVADELSGAIDLATDRG